MAGCTVVEFELMATAAPPGASRGRRPSSTSTVPKKLTEERSEPARSGVPATPAQVTMPDSVPGSGVPVPAAVSAAFPAAKAVASAMARDRSLGRARSATTSVSRRSMPMTRQPAASSLVAVARPIPDAAPVMTTVRSGTGEVGGAGVRRRGGT